MSALLHSAVLEHFTMGLLLIDVVLTKETFELATALVDLAAALVPFLLPLLLLLIRRAKGKRKGKRRARGRFAKLLSRIWRDKARFEKRAARAQEAWISARFSEAPRASPYKPTERKVQHRSAEKQRRRRRTSKRPKEKR
jgi:hypothetical protein